LAAGHDLTGFDCGDSALNDWLARLSRRMDEQDIARVYVWTRVGAAAVVAYFSVSPTLVLGEQMPRATAGGNSQIPGYLLARFALDLALQGQGLGRQLLLSALEAIVAASAASSGRLIVVDPADGAASFYAKYGFRATGTGHRMFMKVATARQALRVQ
jgi:predicted GNAT family N-acyltransferase